MIKSLRRLALLPVAFVLLTACPERPAPDERVEVPEYTIEQFLETTSVFGSSFSPDKSKILVSSNESGVYNAYAVPVAGGEPTQLTDSTTDAIMVASYFPHDERFIYSSDQGGNELNHVFVRELDGTITDLTPGDELKASFFGWADDYATFFIGTTERDPRYFDVYEVTVDGYERSLFFQNDTGMQFAGVSPDKRYIALLEAHTTSDTDIHLFDRETSERIHLTPHEGQVANGPQAFSRDGKSMLYTTDQGAEFSYLMRYDLATGIHEELLRPDWDVAYATYSRNGAYLVVAINNDARNQILLFDAASLQPVELPDLPGVDITSVNFSRDAELMAFYANSSRSPSNLYVRSMPAGEPRQLTDTINPAIDPDHLVEGEVVRFASFDGTEVPGILYRPHRAGPDSPVPALVWVHGGPGGQSRLGYSGLIQYLVNHGYAVYAINNRGSSGYGKTFFKMDDRNHGQGDLMDCVASKDMLIDTGWVDPERIGIIGGSYGGYMVLAALAFQPEEFRAGVDIFGVSNWLRTLRSIPPWWESFREALYEEMGNPEEDEEYLRRISPLFHADKIRRPLMVLQGANDPRVLKAESDEIVAAVKANGVPVVYKVFDDEGHGFRKTENQIEGWRAVLEFLDVYVKGDGPASDEAQAIG